MEDKYYTIGQILKLLKPEFSELSSSSLRFLEKEGLLHPQRTQGGHRLYKEDDIARIRLIKRLQFQRYYPLEVIRHLLVKLERAKDVEAEMVFLESIYSPVSYDPNFTPLSRKQLAVSTGLSPSEIDRLEGIGLLFPYRNGNGRQLFDEDDLKIAELVARELRLGAELKDFVPYAKAVQALVKEEINLFQKLAGEEQLPMERSRQLKEDADLLMPLLRSKLIRRLMVQRR